MQGRELGSAVIAQIRREKFWLDREGEVGARNPLIDDLQASVQHLSEGLYSKETHFVLELIQNAEDNAYTDGVTPSLSMELLDVDPLGTPGAEGALVISNNERGFRPTDVQALCSVGASTKKARKQEGSGAFIGDKGIGFKSVFVVSARPAIFSNGFHFCFNEAPEASTGLGYIVPTSIERVPAAVEAHLAADHTVILLPLKPGKRAKVERELASIAPETLLFLNKIAQLRVVVNGRVLTEVERRVAPVRALGAPGAEGGDHLGEGDACAVVTLLTRTGSGSGSEEQRRDYWFYAHEEALPADVLELSRAGVQARSCAVALPLRSGVDTDDLSALQCSGRVYAFLPTEVHSRVPFLLNADFVLSSSRESIQVHRPWNLWLRNSLATAFVRGFLALLRAPPSAGSARDAYAFAPLTSSSFFAELRTAALATLAGERCVLAQPLAGRSGALVLPADARIAPPALCALLGRCERWPEHLLGAAAVAGRGEEAEDARPRPVSLVDAAVAALYGAQLEALGVRALGVDDWAAILGDARWLGSLDAKELIEVYALLAAEEWTTPAALRGLPLLRIESAPAVRAARRSRGPLSPSPLSPLSPLALHGEARGAMAASSAERPVYAASEEAVPEAVAELLLPILAATDGGAADGAEPMRLMCRAVLRQPTPAPGAASELPTGEETRRGSTQVQATNPPPQQNLRALRMQAISHGQRADPPPLIKTASEMQGTVSASSTHSPTHSQLAPAALTLFRGVRALHARGEIINGRILPILRNNTK
ncbi:hypothetical protein T492DRAFT_1147460 [Pavlovales sp. CCMP2436]|nr:hypothetical protein T492DRAFT_1147460 [Pavlovales sp. CCMP2436]